MAELPGDDHLGPVASTWSLVERVGMPNTPVRRTLFDLAKIIETGSSDELLLASAAYRALATSIEDVYRRRSPLEQQLEYIKASRELQEATGIRSPDVSGDRFELAPLPESPAALAAELGYHDGGRAVRRVLREKFGLTPGGRWHELTERQVNYVRAHLPPRQVP
ncbi:hypothetical protein [Curtobacterium flaccumfaciens]|uniref:hypothetical protein n=1 Tax=Curtobacterium flaccumfaciens TaxID=2035 RepID=UPI0038790B31